MAVARSGTTMQRLAAMDFTRIAWRDSVLICRCTSAATSPASFADGVTRMAWDCGSCSACASRSAATKSGRAALIGNDQHFGGSGRHVHGRALRIGGDLLLGRGDPGIAGAEDLVDLGNRSRAIGQGGDRLGATHLEHGVDAAQLRGHQHRGMRAPSRAGGVHSTRRGQPARRAGTASMITAEGRGAEPAGTYRPTAPIARVMRSQRTPGDGLQRQRRQLLGGVELFDVRDRPLQGGDLHRRQLRACGGKLRGADREPLQAHAIEALR